MTSRVLTSTGNTISINVSTSGYCNIDLTGVGPNTLSISTINSTSNGVYITNTDVYAGNSSVNSDLNVVGLILQINSTSNTIISNSTITLNGNSTVNTVINSISFICSNSTVSTSGGI